MKRLSQPAQARLGSPTRTAVPKGQISEATSSPGNRKFKNALAPRLKLAGTAGHKRPPLRIKLSASTGQQYLPYLRRHLKAAAALVRTRLTEFSVILVGDRRMSELHMQFMNIPGPTDVLTFPIDEDSVGHPTSGEVYICVPEARRQSRAGGTAVRDEVLLYAIHGLLHLSGFDDRTRSGYGKMHRTEDDILSRLGIGRVFEPLPSEAVVASDPAPRGGAMRSGLKPPSGRPKHKLNHRSRGDR